MRRTHTWNTSLTDWDSEKRAADMNGSIDGNENRSGLRYKTSFVLVVIAVTALILLTFTTTDSEQLDADNKCGNNITWTIEDGVLILEGSGTMYDYSPGGAPWYSSRNSIVKIELHNGVSSFGINSIGKNAFRDLTNVTKVDFNQDPYLPGLNTISEGAFYNSMLNAEGDLEIPAGLYYLGADAFYGCHFTGKVIVPLYLSRTYGNNTINSCVFDGGIEIKNGMDSLIDHLFTNCTFGSGDLVFPSSIISIRDNAFNNCTFAGNLVLPDNVTEIGPEAFQGCIFKGGEGELRLSQKTITIDTRAFNNCKITIKDLLINTEIRKLGANAFGGNYIVIEQVSVMHGCSGIDDNAFGQYKFYRGETEIVSYESSYFLGHIFEKTGDDKKLYSCGDVLEYVVYYDLAGGSGETPEDTYHRPGDIITIPECKATKDSCKFMGWGYNDKEYQPGTSFEVDSPVVEFKAIWVEGYWAIFDIDGGTGSDPKSMLVQTGEKFDIPQYSGTKTGFEFGGWTCNGRTYGAGTQATMGTSNMVFIAKWVPVHKVSYDINGGSGYEPSTSYVKEGAEFHVKGYSGTKTGYVYEGWIYNGVIYKAGDTITMGKKDITILAVWTETHSVTYDLNGGTGTAPTQSDVAKGHSFTVQGCTATKEGYVFKGWSYDRLTFQEGDVITMELEDITLTAIWKRGQPLHKVTYDLNGGSGTAPIQADVEEGATFTVKLYNGTKEGFVFKGWSYDDKTYNMGATITMGSKDIVLTAIWGSNEPEKKDDNTMMILMAAAAIGGFAAVLAIGITIIRRP